jgi:hypothetical protein
MPKKTKAKRVAEFSGDWFLGPPPLLPGDDADAYNELLRQVTDAFQPSDIVERIWVNDFVYLAWEVLRWRRDKPKFIKVIDTEGVRHLDKTPVMLNRTAQVEQLIAFMASHRNIACHEIMQYRATLAASLQKKMQKLEGTAANENSRQTIVDLATDEYSAPVEEVSATEEESEALTEQPADEAADETMADEADEAPPPDEAPTDSPDQEIAEEA